MREAKLIKRTFILIFMAIACCFGPAALAQEHHAGHQRSLIGQRTIVCDFRGCSDRPIGNLRETHPPRAATPLDANGNSVVIAGRPAGCPYEFCGCEASRYVFGEIRRELNLASNWRRKFALAEPAAGMAAVRSHHVMILMNHVGGSDWLVHDGNSGGQLTREHVRSISGYVIVDPHTARAASISD